MYTTERRRMSLHDLRRRDSLRVSAGSLWQDSLVMDQSANSSVKHIVSPRSRTRAISVAYIVNGDASVPQTEENLSLTCLKDACADVHASLNTISFERISLGTTDVLDCFYNAGKCWHVDSNTAHVFTVFTQTEPSCKIPPADVAVAETSDSFCQPSLFYHLGVRESFSMTNNIILYCYKQDSDLQAIKV